jgi:hypothetical protein
VFVDAYFVISAGGRRVVAFDDSSNLHIAKVLQFLRRSYPRSALEELNLYRYRDNGQLTYRLARALGKLQLTAFRRIGKVERAWDSPYQQL